MGLLAEIEQELGIDRDPLVEIRRLQTNQIKGRCGVCINALGEEEGYLCNLYGDPDLQYCSNFEKKL